MATSTLSTGKEQPMPEELGLFIDKACNSPGLLGTCQTMSNPVKYGHDDGRRTDLSARREQGSAGATGAARRTHQAAASGARRAERRYPAARGADEPLE